MSCFNHLTHALCSAIVPFLLGLPHLQAQESDSLKMERAILHLGLASHYGFIIPHSSAIQKVADSNPWGVEADLSLHFTNARAWNYLQGYPRLGATLSYFNFNNPDVLGRAYALIVYAEPFLSAHRNFSLSFRLGGGIAYMDTPYDPMSNPHNLFYSTAFSFPLTANLLANYRLSPQLLLRAGGTYHHISNGGTRQPNKGINFPTATAGISYAIRPAAFPVRERPAAQEAAPKLEYLVALIGGYKDRADEPERKLPILGMTAYVSQRVGRIQALTAGGEWIADLTIKKRLEAEGKDANFQRGALLVGHALQIGRFRFNQQLGIYVYAPVKAKDPVYQRWGLEYHSPKRIFWGINLKAHRHVADFLDVRLGLKW